MMHAEMKKKRDCRAGIKCLQLIRRQSLLLSLGQYPLNTIPQTVSAEYYPMIIISQNKG